jgi:hypothetical protein
LHEERKKRVMMDAICEIGLRWRARGARTLTIRDRC